LSDLLISDRSSGHRIWHSGSAFRSLPMVVLEKITPAVGRGLWDAIQRHN
jgi:hypothetical protein